ncbi:MAG: DM13 domain-containing protein [Elainellaceae cyanobacterium]
MNRLIVAKLMAIALTATGAIAACQSQPTIEGASEESSEGASDVPAETTEVPQESTETATTSASVRSGAFVPGEHNTTGTAELREVDGEFVIAFSEDFQTIENAPDPVIVLHKAEDVIGSTEPPAYPLQESDYVEIAPLQSPSGAQEYQIAAEIDPAEYASVVVWCREFNATFAAAPLQ